MSLSYTTSTSNRVLAFDVDKRTGGRVEVRLHGRPAGALTVSIFRPGNCGFDKPLTCDAATVTDHGTSVELYWSLADQSISVVVQLRQQNDGLAGAMTIRGSGHAVARLVWTLPTEPDSFALMPAFMYGRNDAGCGPWGQYPRLSQREAIDFARPWISPQWHVRADRSSHGMTSMITQSNAYALGGRDVSRYVDNSVAEKNGLGTSSTSPPQLSFSLGFANIPHTYCAVPGRNHLNRPEGYVDLDRGPATSDLFLLGFAHQGRHSAASCLLRRSYAWLHEPNDHPRDLEDAIAPVAEALVAYGYCDRARNFRSTFTDNPSDTTQDAYFASGWAGGAQVAYPLLLAGHRYNRPDWLETARAVLDNLARNAINPRTELFFDNFDLTRNTWNTRGWWYDALEQPGHSGYVNGQVCYYLLQGYALEHRRGRTPNAWLTAAKRVLDHVVAEQAANGGFGYTYDENTGKILDADGFSGAWFVPALVVLHRLTSDKRYIDSAVRAMTFYRQAVEVFSVYGGPHDIFKSPDSEGILAWIRAAHLLHESTGDPQYLADLLSGIEYELSWKFAYNVTHEHDPLKAMNWQSVGGSVTSVNNPHIHPMNSMVMSSLRHAADATGDEYLRSRLDDTTAWTSSIIMRRDGAFDWGKCGMINERYCHTDALLLERYPDGRPASTWFCGHSWASGSVLEACLG
jgi:hypothetical protein